MVRAGDVRIVVEVLEEVSRHGRGRTGSPRRVVDPVTRPGVRRRCILTLDYPRPVFLGPPVSSYLSRPVSPTSDLLSPSSVSGLKPFGTLSVGTRGLGSFEELRTEVVQRSVGGVKRLTSRCRWSVQHTLTYSGSVSGSDPDPAPSVPLPTIQVCCYPVLARRPAP